jgi:DegV family protein with EDD domain
MGVHHTEGLTSATPARQSNLKIVTDSAADLPVEEVTVYGIEVAPLSIHFPEGEVKSDEITPDEFYDRLRAMVPKVPTTSQPSSGFFTKLYQKIAVAGDEVLSVHISSGLSGTIEAARMGADRVREILVTPIDSLTLSGGQRFQVLAAALAARGGWTKHAIQERLDQIRAQTEVIYTLDTLDYLARGGRIGRVQAIAGSLLHLKPIISVDKKDGKYNSIGKERTLSKALKKIVDHLAERFGADTSLWVTILHGQFQEQAEQLAELIRERLPVARLEILRISPVLGVHTGPGIVGAAVVPMQVMEGID